MAGYPEAHPDAIVSDADEMDKVYWKDVHYLKEKVRDLNVSISGRRVFPQSRCRVLTVVHASRLMRGARW